MTSRDFCYWLQGFFELRNNDQAVITAAQAETIQKHLAMVFKHEIDPSMGDEEHQKALNELHAAASANAPTGGRPDVILRC